MGEYQIERSDASWTDLSFEERYQRSIGGSDEKISDPGLRNFQRKLVATDASSILLALAVGLALSSRQSGWSIHPLVAIYATPLAIAVLWFALLIFGGCYDQRFLGLGADEARRIISATLYTFAAVAGVSFLIRADISRAYAFVSLPLGLALIVIARFWWRTWLSQQRSNGRFLVPTIVVGTREGIHLLRERFSRHPSAGFAYVAQVQIYGIRADDIEAWLDQIDLELARSGGRAVAVDPGTSAAASLVRQLAWRLEGRGIDLLVVPGALDVAGPRLSIRPVAGLPLMHLDEVSLTRSQRVLKRCLDLVGSTLSLIGLLPLLLMIVVAVKLSSPGPVIFRQTRIGQAGMPFTMLKFRTMVEGAEFKREQLRRESGSNEPAFKLVGDPRITGLGKHLRRWSIDELPQLLNVLGGSMSLVGPRPHPVDDVDRYDLPAFRRLALKPGMTGLWQVEGRSEVNWDQALQLDIHYVEQWSISADIALLARTLKVVAQGRGAH